MRRRGALGQRFGELAPFMNIVVLADGEFEDRALAEQLIAGLEAGVDISRDEICGTSVEELCSTPP